MTTSPSTTQIEPSSPDAGRRRRLRRILLALLGISVALSIVSVLLAIHTATAHPRVPLYDFLKEGTVGGIALVALTAVLVIKIPEHRVTWMFVLVDLLGSMQQAFGGYAVEALRGRPGDLPLGLTALNVSAIAQLWFVIGFLAVVFLFPTGQPVSGRWWVVIWAYAPIAFLEALVLVTSSQRLRSGVFPPLLDLELPGLVETGGLIISVLAIGGTFTHVIVRFVRSKGLERQQLKWFVFTFVFGFAVLLGPWTENDVIGSVVWTLVPMAILTSIAIAILRYKLYEIDRIVSRTVSYAVVVGLLAAVFFGLVTVLAGLLSPDQPLVVAASTLAVFALFNPVRKRVQSVVDRHFDRRRYDAQQVIETFTGTLRDRVDPDGVVDGWVGVVSETMQPSAVGAWLR